MKIIKQIKYKIWLFKQKSLERRIRYLGWYLKTVFTHIKNNLNAEYLHKKELEDKRFRENESSRVSSIVNIVNYITDNKYKLK